MSGKIVPRKYFSGGFNLKLDNAMSVSPDASLLPQGPLSQDKIIEAEIKPDMAMAGRTLNQKEAQQWAEETFAYWGLDNEVKQMVIQGRISQHDVLVLLRDWFIERSYANPDFLPVSREWLHSPRTQKRLSAVILRRLTHRIKNPDIFSEERRTRILEGKNILITSSGYIAKAVVQALLNHKAKVVIFSRNPQDLEQIKDVEGVTVVQGSLNQAELEGALKEYKIDGVIHLAAEILVPKSNERPAQYFHSNVVGTMDLLKAMHDVHVRNIVFASSTLVYSGKEFRKGLLEEDMFMDPQSAYGATKYVDELLIKEMYKEGIHSVILRTFNVAGAFYWLGRWWGERPGQGSHVIARLIKSYLYPKDVSFTIAGDKHDTPDGTTIRDFVHVLDVADAYVRSMAHLLDEGDNLVLNVGTRKGASIKTLVKAFKRVIGRSDIAGLPPANTIRPKIGEPRFQDPPKLMANIDRMQYELGTEPQRSLADILNSALMYHYFEGRDRSLGSNLVPSQEDPKAEWAYMREVRERVMQDDTISIELKFEILNLLFIYTLSERFIRDKDYNPELKAIEEDLFKDAMQLPASPEGSIHMINDSAFYINLLNYKNKLQSFPDHDPHSVISERKRYIEALLELRENLPSRPNLPLTRGPSLLTREQEEKLIRYLISKEEFDEDELTQFKEGLSARGLMEYLRFLALAQRLKRDPVNQPKDWDFLVPVFARHDDQRPRAIKWYGAAMRDRDWIHEVSAIFVDEHGNVICRNEKGELSFTDRSIVEYGLNFNSAAQNDIGRKYDLPTGVLQQFPGQNHYYDIDPLHRMEGLKADGIYYGKGDADHWAVRRRVVEKIYGAVLTAQDERAMDEALTRIREVEHKDVHFKKIKPRELIAMYEAGGEGLSYALYTALHYEPFRKWLLSMDKAQASAPVPTGGIDLRPSFKALEVQKAKDNGPFKIDSTQLAALKNASGFVPVILNILPLTDLRAFLGVTGGQ